MGQCIVNYLSSIINDKNIRGKEREILIVLKSLDKGNINKVQVKISTLMELMNTTSKRSVCNILRNLKNKGYSDMEKNGGRAINVYRFTKNYLIVGEFYASETVPTNKYYDNKNDDIKFCSKENYTIKDECGNQKCTTEEISGKENHITRSFNNINNNNYINNNLNDVFINIFKHWNKQNINNVLGFDSKIRKNIVIALKKYSFDAIIKAISNYGEIYYSSYFYDIKWNINSFLTSSKGIEKFTDNGCMWQRYRENYYRDVSYYEEDIFDKYSYIDV